MSNSTKPGIGNSMADSLAMPAFPYILVFMLTGIVAFSTRRGDLACFAGTISSALLYLIYSTYLSTQVLGLVVLAGVLGLLTAFAVWEMQFRKKGQGGGESPAAHVDYGVGQV